MSSSARSFCPGLADWICRELVGSQERHSLGSREGTDGPRTLCKLVRSDLFHLEHRVALLSYLGLHVSSQPAIFRDKTEFPIEGWEMGYLTVAHFTYT